MCGTLCVLMPPGKFSGWEWGVRNSAFKQSVLNFDPARTCEGEQGILHELPYDPKADIRKWVKTPLGKNEGIIL